MKISSLETFLTNAGARHYLFVRLTTDNGLQGIGEASLEWQERAVEAILNEWAAERVVGMDPFDIEANIGGLVRDQYQGGATVMTAISAIDVACWDLIGKACGQPIYKLLGGRAHERLMAYANGWYGGASTPADFAGRARKVVTQGYRSMKFDPFATAWKHMDNEAMRDAEAIVAAVRDAVGDEVELMIEVHGRLAVECAVEMGRRLEKYRPAWYEEPVTPNSLELLREVKDALPFPIAAGERVYTLEDFYRLTELRAVDIVQMDPAHCGGLMISKKVAAMAEAQDMRIAPHCSIGPVALCAAMHLDWATPNAMIQEYFGDFDVPWRHELVGGWNPVKGGEYALPEKPGLGIELNTELCAAHPYKKQAFPSLWAPDWVDKFASK